jgi:hypothetical protein
VAGDPTDVGGAPIDVAVVIIEDVFVRERGVAEIARTRVQHALGFSGRAGGVEDEQRIFRAHFDGRAFVGHFRRFLVVPDVAALVHQFVRAGALDHDHTLDVGALGERHVGVAFQGHRLAAAQALVGRHHHVAGAIENAAREAVGRKAGEDDRMNRAQPRAGEHRVGGFRNHRKINGDAVAFLHAVRFQHVGETADLAMQLRIGDVAQLRGIVALPDDRGAVRVQRQMPVDAVGRDVQRAVFEPFDAEILQPVGGVLHRGEGLDPIELLAFLAPEAVRVGDGVQIPGVVFFGPDEGALFPCIGDGNECVGHGGTLRCLGDVSGAPILAAGHRRFKRQGCLIGGYEFKIPLE